jgi:hypothetical protein
MARLRWSLLGLIVIGAWFSVGCGDDPAPPSGSNSDSDDDSAADVKDAGKAKDAGKDAGGKDAGVATVECGSKTCKGTAAMPPIPATTPCCFSEEDELCSVESLTAPGTCNAPVEADDRCESVNLGGMMAEGCCTENNHCGLNFSMFGGGCLDLASPTAAMIPIMLPAAKTCDGEPIDTGTPIADAGPSPTADAGTSDAGTSDAGKSDAAISDAGRADAGRADAGRDAGR